MEKIEQDNIRQQLCKQYHTLPLLHQRILQLRALILHLKINVYFIDWLITINLGEESINKVRLRSVLNDLIKQGLLREDYSLNHLVLHYISVLATSDANPYAKNNIASVKKIVGGSKQLDIFAHDTAQKQMIHFAVYTNDVALFFPKRMDCKEYCAILVTMIADLMHIGWPDVAWLKTRHPIIQVYLCCARLVMFHEEIDIVWVPDFPRKWIAFYRSEHFVNIIKTVDTDVPLYIQRKFLQINLNMGLCEEIQATCDALFEDNIYRLEALGALSFLREDFSMVVHHYNKAITLFDSVMGKKLWFESNIHVVFYLFAQLQAENYSRVKRAIGDISHFNDGHIVAIVLMAFLEFKRDEIDEARRVLQNANRMVQQKECMLSELFLVLYSWCIYFLEPQEMNKLIAEYKRKFLLCREVSHYLFAHLYAELVLVVDNADAECLAFLTHTTPFGKLRFLQLFQIKQPWEYAVDKLHQVIADQKMLARRSNAALSVERLIWLLDPNDMAIDVAVQKQLKNGNWSSGRILSWRQLSMADTRLDCLTEQDLYTRA